ITEKYETVVGGNFTVTYTVTNVGGGGAGASNTTIYINGINVLEDPVTALAAGANYTNTVGPFDCPCSTTLNVTVCADNGNAVTECNETNNCLSNELKCLPCGLPDLEITDIRTKVKEGKKFNTTSIYYNITNKGDAKARRSVSNLTVDGVEQKKKDRVDPLLPGETLTRVFKYRGTLTQSTITVCADYKDRIAESDETNNCLSNELKCLSCGLPDLEITAIWTKVKVGKKFNTTIISYNITNNGDAKARRSVSNLTVDGVEQKKKDRVDPLAPEETLTRVFNYRGTPSKITVCADYNNKIVESDETNNCLEVP
ncbi:MAG: hypothetical protein KAT65_14675, partial [Methanophagales archaeon]|nr:hypothetical protein [Methanophagales archaeon]